jgi:ATP-dependent Clp protease adaptor protein ClpS
MITRLVATTAGDAMVCNPLDPARPAWQWRRPTRSVAAGPAATRAGCHRDSARPAAAMASSSSPTAVQERQRVRQPYPNYRVIVLDDNVNTFHHVVDCLVRHLPGMQPDRAWELAHRIDGEGSAVVWCGPQEQAELYHELLGAEGLTMAPLERD